jgi:N-acetylglucosamine-6-phosphate deacetylase
MKSALLAEGTLIRWQTSGGNQGLWACEASGEDNLREQYGSSRFERCRVFSGADLNTLTRAGDCDVAVTQVALNEKCIPHRRHVASASVPTSGRFLHHSKLSSLQIFMRPFDVQINGYAGVDFCSDALTGEELHTACEALQRDGVDGILATVITDSVPSLVAKLSNMVRLREADPLVQQLVAGFHIEGPFLNPEVGYIGAHPSEAVVPANVDDTKRLLDAAGGLTRIFTLAPEQDPTQSTTKYLAEQGVTVSAGHCNPDLDELKASIDAGLSMVTHFGNGCPVVLPRHNNILQRFLACRKSLWFSFIPDGAHVDFFALKNYLDLIGLDRCVMVTDAITAATLGPGLHEISGMTVEVDAKGVARKPGSPNLAGSTITMPGICRNLKECLNLNESDIRRLVDTNPRQAIGMKNS